MEQLTIFDALEMADSESVPFEEQREIFKQELNQVFEYVDAMEVYEADERMFSKNRIIDEDMMIYMMRASHAGTILRLAYYKYCYKKGFDVRALADASVLIYMFCNVYRFQFANYINRKEVKAALNKTPYPKWTKLGLIGGSTREIIDLGEEFGRHMDSLR